MRSALVLALCVVLVGCVPPMPLPPPRDITCEKGEDCEVRWGRALEWVLTHSAWKIDQQTDSLISTMNGPDTSTESSFTITKTATGGGRYRILFAAGCQNWLGCVPSVPALRADFEAYVLAPIPGAEPEAE